MRRRRLTHTGCRREITDAELAPLEQADQQPEAAAVREQPEHPVGQLLDDLRFGQGRPHRRHPAGVDDADLAPVQGNI